jgi:hypothetical protein
MGFDVVEHAEEAEAETLERPSVGTDSATEDGSLGSGSLKAVA